LTIHTGNGVDGEKYRGGSVTVSGRQWEARTQSPREEHSGAATWTRDFRQ